jgi:hypothetical protein
MGLGLFIMVYFSFFSGLQVVGYGPMSGLFQSLNAFSRYLSTIVLALNVWGGEDEDCYIGRRDMSTTYTCYI